MSRILPDTGVALRLYDVGDPLHLAVAQEVERRSAQGDEFLVAPQVLYELWVVLTRPRQDRGQGLLPESFNLFAARLRSVGTFLPDPDDLVDRWSRLCDAYGVVGKRCHDVRLVAWMQAHGVDTILTLNPRNFSVFPITVLAPGTI